MREWILNADADQRYSRESLRPVESILCKHKNHGGDNPVGNAVVDIGSVVFDADLLKIVNGQEACSNRINR